jgi:hypothetical protein
MICKTAGFEMFCANRTTRKTSLAIFTRHSSRPSCTMTRSSSVCSPGMRQISHFIYASKPVSAIVFERDIISSAPNSPTRSNRQPTGHRPLTTVH